MKLKKILLFSLGVAAVVALILGLKKSGPSGPISRRRRPDSRDVRFRVVWGSLSK